MDEHQRILNGLAQIEEDRDAFLTTLGVIQAETMAISKDLHSIKRELQLENRSPHFTTLGAIDAQIADIREELGLDKLDRIRAVVDCLTPDTVRGNWPEGTLENWLLEILEILAE